MLRALRDHEELRSDIREAGVVTFLVSPKHMQMPAMEYDAGTCGLPKDLPKEEIQGVIALTAVQVIRGLERRPTLAELVEEGASVVAGGETVSRGVRLYPIGTAMALAHILRHAMKEG